MKKFLVGLASMAVLVGCNNEEEPEEQQETQEEVGNETETSEQESEDVEEEQDPVVELLESNVSAEPVQVQRTFWNDRGDVEMDIDLEVGPFIQDENFAVLPVTVSTESEGEIGFDRIFDLWGTGDNITAHSGYGIRVFDPESLVVSHIAVINGREAYDSPSRAFHTFIGEGSRAQQMTLNNEREEPIRYFAAFSKTDSESIAVMFEKLGIVEDIPVIDREDSGYYTNEELEEAIGEREDEEMEKVEELLEEYDVNERLVPNDLELIEGEILERHFEDVLALGDDYVDYVQARTHPLERYSTALETSVSRIDEVDYSTLILSSDVLFEFDESELTDEADAELEAAINELEGVEGGELEIVGHTDNVNTEEYNQELSENRAESVYERLNELTDLDLFDEVSTRGESFREPIADNDTDEGQAQNRRVELHFTPPTEEIEIASDEEIPEALGTEVAYPETAETEYGEIELVSFRQVENTFVGTLKVSPTSENIANYDAVTHRAGVGARGLHQSESARATQWTAYPITLIHNGRRYYPLDYYLEPLADTTIEEIVEGEDQSYIVPMAERYVFNVSEDDGYYYASFVWPAFDVDEVIIDKQVSFAHQNRDTLEDISEHDIEVEQPWRMTNVPVDIEDSMEATDSDSEENDSDEEGSDDEEDVEETDESEGEDEEAEEEDDEDE